ALGRVTATALTATDWLEGDGVDDADLAITVRVDITDGVFHVDFTGTAQAARGNVNCPLAVARSAVLFVVRTLLPGDVPTNGGVQRTVRVVAPPGCLVNAQYPSAVAAGNVETSQRIVDVLLGALTQAIPDRIPAGSAGTMSSLSLGGVDPRTGRAFTYYETICGGSRAAAAGPGEPGIHTHMTNTRNTPIEALETAFPLRVQQYCLAAGSGGSGDHHGGDGIVRALRAHAEMTGALLADR